MLIHTHTNSSTKLFHSVTSATSLPDPHTITASDFTSAHWSSQSARWTALRSAVWLTPLYLQLLCSHRKHV